MNENEKALFEAISDNNSEVVKKLINKIDNIDVINEFPNVYLEWYKPVTLTIAIIDRCKFDDFEK